MELKDIELKPSDIVEDVIEQRKASMRYYNENFYKEFAEIYRNINGRARAVTKKDPNTGQLIEDHTRTNVCTPDHFVMLRRGTARLTRNPPNLRVRGGPDSDQGQQQRDKVSAHLMFQWDRSEAQRAFKRISNIAYGLGWGVGKSHYDEVPVTRQLRRLTQTLQPQDFSRLANARDPRIAAAVQKFGDRFKDQQPFSTDEQSQLMAEFGNDVPMNVSTVRYKGPVLTAPFIGDIFPEPGFKSISESGYIDEMDVHDAQWLKYWQEQTTVNPITGEESSVFDKDACAKALSAAGQRQYIDQKELSLRRLMRDEITISDPMTAGKPARAPKKRVLVDERHTIITDEESGNGFLCVDFVAEESTYLGRLWYPWETYGRYLYSEMVLIPDWLGGIGQSTLRVSRFLQQLRNTRRNQITDHINNVLLPLLKSRKGSDLTGYDIARTGWGRLLELDDLRDVEGFVQDPQLSPSAWTDEASLQRDMQQVDPTTIDFAPGTASAQTPGKFATTAKLAANSSDSVTADTIDQMGLFIRDVVELNLWMDQQAMSDNEEVPGNYMDRINALSIRSAGAEARTITITPMDIQEDFEILPEQGSTLAADDEFRVQGLQQFAMLGAAHPDIVNMRAVITALARATPGVNAEDVILPPPPPQPPVPPVKLNINLQIKWEDLEPDVQSAILQHEGLPTELTHVEGVGNVIKKMSDASDAAENLESTANPSAAPLNGNGKGMPIGAAKRG